MAVVCDQIRVNNVAHSCADAVRRHFGKEFDLLGDGYAFLWVNDFPLLEYDKNDNIRDVIAFPKTTSATDLMSSAPSAPSAAQIKELHLRWDN